MTTTDTTTDPPTQTWPTLPDGRYAVLRCCNTDGTSSHRFTWPLNVGATVVAVGRVLGYLRAAAAFTALQVIGSPEMG